jgi:hypothetical protein
MDVDAALQQQLLDVLIRQASTADTSGPRPRSPPAETETLPTPTGPVNPSHVSSSPQPCLPPTNATVRLSATGWAKVVAATPGHVATVREQILDTLTPEQVDQLATIAAALLTRLDLDGTMSPRHRPR